MARADKVGEGFGGGGAGMGRAIAGKASGAKAKLTSTGKAKVNEYKTNPSKKYEPPVKGSGKPKYQNVVKEGRLNTKKSQVESTTKVKEKILGKNVTKQEKRAIGNRVANTAKMIDRETKVGKGQRTEKPLTPKVPVKKSGKK